MKLWILYRGVNPRFAFDPPVNIPGDGESIERVPVTTDTDSAEDWKIQSSPIPGQVVFPTQTPTASLTSTSTHTPTFTDTPTPSSTVTPTSTATSTPTNTPTPSVTSTGTQTSTFTPTPSSTPSLTATSPPELLHLVISEVYYDPIGNEPDEEWIEIYNPGNLVVDLSVYKLGDEETSGGGEGMLSFPAGLAIAPGEVLVVANRATAFQTLYGFLPDIEMNETDASVPNMFKYSAWATGSLALNNDGDEILLLDANDQYVDLLSYGTSTFAFNPPAPDVSAGHSLARQPANHDSDSAQDWIDQAIPNPNLVIQ